MIPAHERDWPYQQEGDLQMECEKIIVRVPIRPNRDIDQILKLRTNTIYLSSGPIFSITKNNIVFEVQIKGYRLSLDNKQVGDIIISSRSEILSSLNSKNQEIKNENEKLKRNLTQFINDRKEKLDSDQKRIKELVNLIKIPLARKDEDLVKKIQMD